MAARWLKKRKRYTLQSRVIDLSVFCASLGCIHNLMPAPIWKLDAGGVAYLIEIRRVAKYMILDEKHRQLLAEIPEGYHLEMMHLPFRNLYVSQKQIQKDGLTEDEVLAEVMNFIGYIDKDLIKYK